MKRHRPIPNRDFHTGIRSLFATLCLLLLIGNPGQSAEAKTGARYRSSGGGAPKSWYKNRTYTISWRKGSGRVRIVLLSGSRVVKTIARSLPDLGQYQWRVPASLQSRVYTIQVKSIAKQPGTLASIKILPTGHMRATSQKTESRKKAPRRTTGTARRTNAKKVTRTTRRTNSRKMTAARAKARRLSAARARRIAAARMAATRKRASKKRKRTTTRRVTTQKIRTTTRRVTTQKIRTTTRRTTTTKRPTTARRSTSRKGRITRRPTQPRRPSRPNPPNRGKNTGAKKSQEPKTGEVVPYKSGYLAKIPSVTLSIGGTGKNFANGTTNEKQVGAGSLTPEGKLKAGLCYGLQGTTAKIFEVRACSTFTKMDCAKYQINGKEYKPICLSLEIPADGKARTFRVYANRGLEGGMDKLFSGKIKVTLQSAPNAPVLSVSKTAVSSGQDFQFTWTKPEGTTSFVFETCKNDSSNFKMGGDGFNNFYTGGTSVTRNYSVLANTSYFFRVKAYGPTGNSAYSNVVKVDITSQQSTAAPYQSGDLAALESATLSIGGTGTGFAKGGTYEKVVGSSKVTAEGKLKAGICFGLKSATAKIFKIKVCSIYQTPECETHLVEGKKGTTACHKLLLIPDGKDHTYKITAAPESGGTAETIFTGKIRITLMPPPAAPVITASKNVVASGEEFQLTWNAPEGATSMHLQTCKHDPSNFKMGGDGFNNTYSSGLMTSKTKNFSVLTATVYCFRVQATGPSGQSAWSNVVKVTVKP